MTAYAWNDGVINPGKLPKFEVLKTLVGAEVIKEMNPGISMFVDNIAGLDAYMKELLNPAAENIPSKEHSATPVYVMATAGMRLLNQDEQQRIYDAIRKIIHGNYKFKFRDSDAFTLTGMQEGLFGWIAINYLLDLFSPGCTSQRLTSGFLDMGGASSQVTFEVPHDVPVPVGQTMEFTLSRGPKHPPAKYMVYVHSYLDYGINRIRERYEQNMLYIYAEANGLPPAGSGVKVTDPCLQPGLVLQEERAPIAYTDWVTDPDQAETYTLIMSGSGDAEKCSAAVSPLLLKDYFCAPIPCAVNGTLQPQMNLQTMDYYGVSNYYYGLEDFLPSPQAAYINADIWPQVLPYCKRNWHEYEEELQEDRPSAIPFKRLACFKAVYVMDMLHTGLSFPKPFKRIYPREKLNGEKIQWSLGALIYMMNSQGGIGGGNGPAGGLSTDMLLLAILLPLLLLLILLLVLLLIFYLRRRRKTRAVEDSEPRSLKSLS